MLLLNGTSVTDAGLEYLERLTSLEALDLGNTQVTDAGLEHLKGLRSLRWLNVHWVHFHDRRVTDEGVKELQGALPNCAIRH